jgi:hypothetical protein
VSRGDASRVGWWSTSGGIRKARGHGIRVACVS